MSPLLDLEQHPPRGRGQVGRLGMIRGRLILLGNIGGLCWRIIGIGIVLIGLLWNTSIHLVAAKVDGVHQGIIAPVLLEVITDRTTGRTVLLLLTVVIFCTTGSGHFGNVCASPILDYIIAEDHIIVGEAGIGVVVLVGTGTAQHARVVHRQRPVLLQLLVVAIVVVVATTIIFR